MSTTTQQRRGGRGGSVVEYAPASNEYQLTELKNVSTARANSTNTVDFNVRLVNSVRDHPCFYDPSDVHYGDRHTDARHRALAWQQIARAVGYTDHVNVLAAQWRKLKERYIKERRKGVAAGEEPLDDVLVGEMEWLDEYVLDGMPASSSAAVAAVPDAQQLYFMEEGEEEEEEDMLGDDFVDQHDDDYQEENALEEEEEQGRGGSHSPAGSAHSGTGSDIDVGGGGGSQSSAPLILGPKDLPGTSGGRGDTVLGMSSHHGGLGVSRASSLHVGRQTATGGAPAPYRFTSASSAHQHHANEGITVSGRGNGTLIAHPKREGSVGGGSTLTMVIDPTTYYQNGTQKMYRLVNVADLDQSQQHHLQHLRPAGGGGMGGGGGTLIAEPAGSMGSFIGRGTRKRMGAPLSPPSHAGGSGMLGGPSSSADLTSPYGKSSVGQLGDDLILDDGIVGENTIVIDHQRDDDSPLLVDSPGMHHHHLMMGGGSSSQQRSMHHRGQLSPTMLGNGSGARSSGGYSPGFSNQGPPNPFATSQYDADLALQHFISQHLSKMNDDDKALAKMNIQRILLDARFGTGTTLRVCMGEEDAELTDAAVASEMVTNE